MSNDLDRRAHQASTRLRELVRSADLHRALPTAPSAGAALVPMLTAGLTVLAAVGLIAWLLLPPPQAEVAATTSVTTAPVLVDTIAVTTTEEGTRRSSITNIDPADLIPPVLTITEPLEGSEWVERDLRFGGTTEPGARVFAGRYEADVDDFGEWEILLILDDGANTARFRAVDAAGNEAFAAVTVFFVPPTANEDKPTTTSSGELAAFDANYTFGTCNIDPPYDEYYGTGQPGSEVRIASEYGSGATVVDANGLWFVKVVFPEAPSGVAFLVTVKDQYGRRETFEFMSTVGS